jgi:uncharacterized membrane protein YfcA
MIVMFDLSMIQWAVLILSTIFIGLTKAGIPSLGVLVVTVLMFVFPAKESIGILLPMLIIGDIFAVIYFRRNVVWKYLFSLMPWVLMGIAIGFFVLDIVNDEQLKPIIGILVLSLSILHVCRERFGEKFNQMLPHSIWFSIFMGILAGFTTMVGNAAGGIMVIYLLVKGLPKKEFIGTGAWFFMFVNVVKIPLYIYLGLITLESISLNVWFIPTILIGAYLGTKILPLLPQKTFQKLVLGFATVGALRLIFV